MNYIHFIVVLVLLSVYQSTCASYKILAIFPVPVRSHYAINSKLVNELANRGHKVTVATPFLQKSPVKNLKEISLESLVEQISEKKKNLCGGHEKHSEISFSHFLFNSGYVLTENVLKHENIQKLLHSDEKYDLVIMPQFLNEGLLGIAHHFKAPLVLVATMPPFPWSNFILAHPTPPSYVPNLLSPYTGHMNFYQRLKNSFLDLYMFLHHQLIALPKHREWVKKYIPGEPDLYDFVNNASLVLINSHMSSYEAIPHVPNAIEVGGLHIDEPKKLPEDLQKFLDSSVNGVIVFSLGSNLKSSEMRPCKRKEILKTFSKLKQNVLWKWEEDNLPDQPKNVRLTKWMPQSDVLAHPNVKALITHGGLLSIMESMYHGIPFIGMPFFGDQNMNMAIAISYEYAIKLDFHELDEEKLSWAINEILNNPKYKNNIQKRSQIIRDQPMKPLDTAVYWVEYVLRHHGAPHLKYPGINLTWYQRNLLDVIAFCLVVIVAIICLIIVIVKWALKLISKKPVDKKKKN